MTKTNWSLVTILWSLRWSVARRSYSVGGQGHAYAKASLRLVNFWLASAGKSTKQQEKRYRPIRFKREGDEIEMISYKNPIKINDRYCK